MPEITDVVRRRRGRRTSKLRASAWIGVLLLAVVPIILGWASLAASRLYLELTYQVPAVEDISAFFDDDGLIPSTVVDRNNEVITALANPGAKERRWVGLADQAAIPASDLLVRSLLAEQDPTFWDNPGYLPAQTAASMVSDLLGGGQGERPLTITEQLVEATLLPVDQYPNGSLRREFRRALLAERLTNRYEKEQILEWYLNSAYFGNFVYGIDSASLTYFGKHANGLRLAEIAVLVSVPGSDTQDLSSPTRIRRVQREVLARLVESGVISQQEADEARSRPLDLRNLEAVRSFPEEIAIHLVQEQAEEDYGRDFEIRGGLTYLTTLDLDLQLQAECLMATQIERLGGATANVNVPARDGSPCLASGLLPPVRPSDAGLNNDIDSSAIALIDPEMGELRAYAVINGQNEAPLEAQQAGELVHPFIYLTAFSRGFSPGSMVLDLPDSGATVMAGSQERQLADFEGPVRMRQALRAGLMGAAGNAMELAGYESAVRTLKEFGLIESDQSPEPADIVDGSIRTDPLTVAYAYGVLANEGVMLGYGNGSLEPKVLDQIEDRFGRLHPVGEEQSRAILSQGLAYLVNDVLLGTRQSETGPGLSSLGLDQPAAWMPAVMPDGGGAWTAAYTPNASLAVWFGSSEGQLTQTLTPAGSTNPAAAALLRYATKEEPSEIWQRPLEVVEVEVCDPSGLLPTTYCPQVVTELYLQGTEPTSFDNLYQPFRLNRDTGNLATLATPLELVEEQIFLVPPPEAAAWAEAVELAQPPSEYDPLPAVDTGDQVVNIQSPEPFAVVRGQVLIEGDARPSDFDFYRLQAGAGLNPSQWIQIGEDQDRRVWSGRLATWDTEALSGLYTLQLVVVLQDGTIRTASVPVTIDNLAPQVSILLPEAGVEYSSQDQVRVEAAIEDGLGLDEVVFSLDGRTVARMIEPPFEIVLDNLEPGRYMLTVEAVDRAGNSSEPVIREIVIIP